MANGIRISVSTCLTAGLAVMAAANLLDESRLTSAVSVLGYWGLWMVLPCGLHALQVQVPDYKLNRFGSAFRYLALLAQAYLLLNYTHYAMNGDTASRHGAEALHLVLVPCISVASAVAVFGVCLIGMKMVAKRARR